MSSVVRTSQTPNFSFQRSSTPMPYSFGKPPLNCCGGSLSTFGNMKRPVAASAAADAAEKAPQARPSHTRRVSNGDVSSGSRVAAFAGAGVFAAAAAAVVVRPARSGTGAAGGRGGAGAAGRTACAPAAAGAGFVAVAPVAAAAAAVAGASPPGTGTCCGVAAGLAPVGGALGTSGLLSSAMLPQINQFGNWVIW